MRALLVALLCLHGACQAQPEGAAADRAHIRAAIDAAEAAYAVAQRDCQERFAVTACVDAARRERNERVHRLRQQDAVFDEAQRRERAALRNAAIRDRAAALELRDRDAAARASAPRMRVVTRSAGGPAGAASAASVPAVAAPASAARRDPADEERRRAEYADRQRRIEAHREAVLRRAAARASATAPVPPLPVPVPPRR